MSTTKEVNKVKEVSEVNEVTYSTPKEVRISPVDAMKFFDATYQQAEKLRFTDVSLYSTTPPNQAKYTAELLLAFYTKEQLKTKIVTDGTSCIGGNVVELAKMVKHVNCVEIEPIHVEILKHNLNTLSINNCTVYANNYIKNYDMLTRLTDTTLLPTLKNTTLLPTLKNTTLQDIIFLDPPWGGVDYKKANSADLYLIDSTISIRGFISHFIKYLCEVMILKIPTNLEHIDLIYKSKAFPHMKAINITAPDGKPLYTLMILSNIPCIDEKKLNATSFPRLGYKYIKLL